MLFRLTMVRSAFVAFVFFIMVVGIPAASLAQSSLSLDDVRREYQKLESLRARFTQVVGSEFSEDSTRIEGTVILSGNRYRVHTPRETVVANDSTTWIYSPADSQVVINDAETEEGPITPESFLASSANEYEEVNQRATTRHGRAHVALQLSARSPAARFRTATLWIRPSDRIITRLQATDRNGSTFDLRLREITANPSLRGDIFRFDAPDGTEVVDLRTSN